MSEIKSIITFENQILISNNNFEVIRINIYLAQLFSENDKCYTDSVYHVKNEPFKEILQNYKRVVKNNSRFVKNKLMVSQINSFYW